MSADRRQQAEAHHAVYGHPRAEWPARPPWRCRQGWHRMVPTHVRPTLMCVSARDGSPVYDVVSRCTRCPAQTVTTTTRVPRRPR